MTASLVVKPGPERKYRWEGRRSCVWCLWLMGFWWGPECCWTVWIWIYLSDMIAAVLSLGGEEKTNNRKHCGVRERREGGVWWGREKKWWNVGVISVSERSGYYPACQSHLPSCLASFLSTPPPHLTSVILSIDHCYGTISEPLTFLALFVDPFSFSPRVARRRTKAQIGDTALWKRKRGSVNTAAPPAANVAALFFLSQRSNWQDCGQDST